MPRSNSSSSEKTGKRKERDAQLDPLARADRARRTAAVGAYREATRLVSSILSFEEQPSPPWEPKLAATQRLSCITPRALLQAHRFSGGTRLGHAQRASTYPRQRAPRGALGGVLPDSAGTRLCWQRKKNRKPRPIKMGELLRSASATRLVNQHQVTRRSKVLRMHKWSISLPGACEGLCHWRGTIDPLAANGTLWPLARPIWTWSTCLALPSGTASAKPSARTSRRLQPGLSGNTKPTLSPPSPREPPLPPTAMPSR